MGCDIHSIGQVFKDGKWVTVLQDVAGDGRSYNTFTLLANVRNYGEGLVPFAEARGLPEDLTLGSANEYGSVNVEIQAGTPTSKATYAWDRKYGEVREKELLAATSVWLGDHSHSYFTLAELKRHWGAQAGTIDNVVVVDERSFIKYHYAGIEPDRWCRSIGGGNGVTLAEADYLEAERDNKLPYGKQIHVQIVLQRKPETACDIPDIIAELEELGRQYLVGDEHVRYVFGFDS